jgi:putative transposase
MPSYTTVAATCGTRRCSRARRKRHSDGVDFAPRETRSYEVTHVHGHWHLDFHEGSRAVLTASGEWKKPQLLGVLDDHSRLCCHLQWYLDETAKTLIHGLSQAFCKRGLPRALLTDNGAAMLAAETTEGLERLGVVHHTTLPYSPEPSGCENSLEVTGWGSAHAFLQRFSGLMGGA